MSYLIFKIYAVDPKDRNHKAVIGTCFNLGLAKAWAEETVTIDDIEIENIDTGRRYFYCKKEKRWE